MTADIPRALLESIWRERCGRCLLAPCRCACYVVEPLVAAHVGDVPIVLWRYTTPRFVPDDVREWRWGA